MLESAIGLYPEKNLRESGGDLSACSGKKPAPIRSGPFAEGALLRCSCGLRRAARAALGALRRCCRRRNRACGRRILRLGNRGEIAAVLDDPQTRDVLQMLIVGFSECMSASAVGREIELLGARRIGGGLDRGSAGIGDGPGRQAVDDVGVVSRRLRDIGLAERAAERALAEGEAVDDGRI